MVCQCVIKKPCAYISGYIDNQLSGEKKPKQTKAKNRNQELKVWISKVVKSF